MAKPKFRAGDLVQLKSGGPVMTIESADLDYYKEWKGTYSCSWFAGDKHQHNNFTEASIEAAEVDE